MAREHLAAYLIDHAALAVELLGRFEQGHAGTAMAQVLMKL